MDELKIITLFTWKNIFQEDQIKNMIKDKECSKQMGE